MLDFTLPTKRNGNPSLRVNKKYVLGKIAG
jgi:hypothetical protein